MPHRHLKFKKVSTLLTGLKTDKNFTQDLFSLNNEKETQKSEKRTALVSALDTLQKKYKGDVVTLGVSPKTKSGHVGTKIAFSRVPDKEEFWT